MVKEILIGNKIYTIQYKDHVILEDEDIEVGAQVDLVKSIIELSKELGDGAIAHALMHEIIHATLFDIGYERLSDNEQLVDSLANYILLLIRQNPQLIKELTDTGNFQFTYKPETKTTNLSNTTYNFSSPLFNNKTIDYNCLPNINNNTLKFEPFELGSLSNLDKGGDNNGK